MILKQIYTYYEPIPSIEVTRRTYSERELISLCEKSWNKHGWELSILCEKDAQKHKYYDEYQSIISLFPSINETTYDYHCYMRWLAMSQVGGGMMIDYDVMNVGFTNQDNFFLTQQIDNNINILQYHVPCVVYGSCEQYLKVCQRFCELIDLPQCIVNIDDKPHTSDMIMLANGFSTNDVNKLKYVADYPNTGLLIHCSFNYCIQNKKDKLGAMFEIWNNQQYSNKNTNE